MSGCRYAKKNDAQLASCALLHAPIASATSAHVAAFTRDTLLLCGRSKMRTPTLPHTSASSNHTCTFADMHAVGADNCTPKPLTPTIWHPKHFSHCLRTKFLSSS
jgi:hypothetical protein